MKKTIKGILRFMFSTISVVCFIYLLGLAGASDCGADFNIILPKVTRALIVFVLAIFVCYNLDNIFDLISLAQRYNRYIKVERARCRACRARRCRGCFNDFDRRKNR